MRRSHNTTSHSLFNLLVASGVDPIRFRAHLEHTLEMEYSVLYANRNKIPDEIYLQKKLTMIETEIIILMLSEVQPV
jgi:hypothetical protein